MFEWIEEKPKPLTMELETAREIVSSAVRKAQRECGLPAFVMEGVIAGVYAEIVSQAKQELVSDYNRHIDEIKEDFEKRLERKETEEVTE